MHFFLHDKVMYTMVFGSLGPWSQLESFKMLGKLVKNVSKIT